jgi:hypothetical protein
MRLKTILFNKLFRSKTSKIIRNLLNVKKTSIILDYTKNNISVSDSFLWRVDKNFKTIFKFNDILKFYLKDNSSNIKIIFFDNKFNFIKEINLNKININNSLIIDQNFLELDTGYGSFYIFHNTSNNIGGMVRNSCYTGFEYKKAIPSFVHGNLHSALKNFSNDKVEFGIGAANLLFKNTYIIQNEMNYEKTEIALINNCNKNLDIDLGFKKFSLRKGCTIITDISKIKIITLKSNSHLLRPIIFNYEGIYLDVYHG